MRKLLALLLLTSAPAVCAQAVPTPAPPAPASIKDFAWLEGTWAGEGFGAQVEEVYSAPAGGQMPGHWRMVDKGKPDLYEFVLLTEVNGSVEYRVRHVEPDMSAREDKDKFIAFPLVSVGK